MNLYILILLVSVSHFNGRYGEMESVSATSQEFTSEEKCLNAGKTSKERFEFPSNHYEVRYICVKK